MRWESLEGIKVEDRDCAGYADSANDWTGPDTGECWMAAAGSPRSVGAASPSSDTDENVARRSAGSDGPVVGYAGGNDTD